MSTTEQVSLSVQGLVVSFETDEGKVQVLDHICFDVQAGETLGIVGESGCGKSVSALGIMRLLPKPAGSIDKGKVVYDGQDLMSLDIEEMHNIRGRKIAMIFQEPMTALNPVHRIGKQLAEVYQLHFPEMTDEEIREASLELLTRVGIPAAEKRIREYPHQLSGGMRQRAMIAMALACKPDILIADEPTTALDVTMQNQILRLMKELQDDIGMSVIFITHDLGVIAETCDRVIVMYAGRVVEQAPVEKLFSSPRHPYTQGLLRSIPKLETKSKSELEIIEGIVPALNKLPSGCRFRTRCHYQQEKCGQEKPELESVSDTDEQMVACLRWRELAA